MMNTTGLMMWTTQSRQKLKNYWQMINLIRFLSKGLEKSINQSDLEECGPVECNNINDSNKPIRRIASINTLYSVVQEIVEPIKLEREYLYSASANEIDEKTPELKDLPSHLEYTYLHGDKSFHIIISSELSDREKSLLL
ncbi:hypothetical protein Tco_1467185 [Tanacetum coccineum]